MQSFIFMYEQEPALYSPEQPGGEREEEMFISAVRSQGLEEAQGDENIHTHTSIQALLTGLRAAGSRQNVGSWRDE